MSTAALPDPAVRPRRPRALAWVGLVLTLAIVVIGLAWAKWVPYEAKANVLSSTGVWEGKAIFGKAGRPGSAPTWDGAITFTGAYFKAVWKAALVAILVAAALETLVPRRWLLRVLTRRSPVAQGIAGAVLALPSMMCTCCTAPVAIGLRRRGAPAGATMAYWLANPLLNPAVLVFLALTMSWQFVAARAAVGLLVVVGAALLVGRVAGNRPPVALPVEADEPASLREMAARYVGTLGRYLLVVIPEYLVLVVLVGLFSGWLSNFAQLGSAAGPLSLLLLGIVAAALVIPTGGEIPVVAGLTAAGASLGVAGVLLITLPALSIPSALLVVRSFGARATLLVTAWVVVGGLLAAGVLTALS